MHPDTAQKLSRFNYLLGETEAAYHEASLKLGLSDSAMRILYALCDLGDQCPLQSICRRSGLSKQTVNSAIRKLEQEGILYLEQATARAKQVCLTERGKALAERTAKRILQIENELFSAWPAGDVEIYLRLTERFLMDFKEKSATLCTDSSPNRLAPCETKQDG